MISYAPVWKINLYCVAAILWQTLLKLTLVFLCSCRKKKKRHSKATFGFQATYKFKVFSATMSSCLLFRVCSCDFYVFSLWLNSLNIRQKAFLMPGHFRYLVFTLFILFKCTEQKILKNLITGWKMTQMLNSNSFLHSSTSLLYFLQAFVPSYIRL